jgi:hypothetical protein
MRNPTMNTNGTAMAVSVTAWTASVVVRAK